MSQTNDLYSKVRDKYIIILRRSSERKVKSERCGKESGSERRLMKRNMKQLFIFGNLGLKELKVGSGCLGDVLLMWVD